MTRRLAGVEIRHFGKQHFGVLIPPEDVAQRRRDLTWRKPTGRYLVEQWLKEMEVTPVDQRHLHGRVTQRLGSIEAAKPASDNHDTMHEWLCPGVPASIRIRCRRGG